jgi:phospholipase C
MHILNKKKLTTVVLAILLIPLILLNNSLISLTALASITAPATTTTPINHLVVIFQENVSFDHYFGSYPNATNPPGEPKFTADSHTPSVNGLTAGLLTKNPNSANPFRLDRSQAITCDMTHAYTSEQQAYNGGLLDKFVQYTGSKYNHCNANQVMGYFDGNTVTALWNYAQHYAMSDNFYQSTFGPSTPGHINLISGQTHGALPTNTKIPPSFKYDGVKNGTLLGNIDPKFDDCSRTSNMYNVTVSMEGKNIGNLLNGKSITWGWFSAGFKLPSNRTGTITNDCNGRQSHTSTSNITNSDYYPDVEPFQYYNSTANPHHLPPTSISMIGHNKDRANHQYDLTDFWNSAKAGNMPSVSFLKAPTYQDGHPEISDPLEEQSFVVNIINGIENLPEWNSTAIILTWDDSDGWYDHVMPPIMSQSNDHKNDRLLGAAGLCGHPPAGAAQDRCGYGPRLPIVVISPYAKTNFIDHGVTDQSSILRFIEDNWGLGRVGNQSFDAKAGSISNMFDFSKGGHHAEKLLLDPSTGSRVTNSTGPYK